MCEPASFIVGKHNVWWSKHTDSHTAIREEHKIKENTDQFRIGTVGVEITPPDGDFNAPPKEWTFRVDQDLLPDWWDVKSAEARVRAILPDWIKANVVLRGETRSKHSYGRLFVAGGVVQRVDAGGVVQRVDAGGVVQRVDAGGVVQCVAGGVVERVYDGVVQRVAGGVVQRVDAGGTVITYTALPRSILKHESAVLIDRSGENVQAFVGPEERSV